MLARDADRAPALAGLVGAFDHHARDRLGAGLRRQDAHLVVDQPHVVELRIDAASAPCAARCRARSTGPLPSATVMVALAVHLELHRRLGFGHQLAARVPAPLVHDAEARQLEDSPARRRGRGAPAARSSPRRRHRHSRRTRAASPSRPGAATLGSSASTSSPISRKRARMLARPDWSETTMWRRLPTFAGSMCS